jgi:tRNA 2-thiouridine synthesizing protein A
LGTQIKHKFDLREVITPFAFLKVTQAFRDMKPGDILQLSGDDPKTRIEIFKVLHTVRYTVVDTQEEGNYYCINIKKEEIMSDLDLSTIAAAGTADARGSACPGPLLEAKKGIGKVKVGEILEIFSNDSGTRIDVPAWAKKVGHEYLGFLETDGYDKHYVRRKK